MDDYQYECASPEAAEMARVIADLFPEQTRFVERSDAPAAHVLDVHWLGARFSSTPRRMLLEIRFAAPAWARYQALKPAARARSHAVLRVYVEAWLGSVEERHANGESVPREAKIELDQEFA